MAWCEENDVEQVFGLARNDCLASKIARELKAAEKQPPRRGGLTVASRTSSGQGWKVEAANAA
jgi:hypothetical protein